MSKSLFIIFCLFAAAFAGTASASLSDAPKSQDSFVTAMGPDPGGHTGARVTPETTKTDRPEVDSARKSASGGNVESGSPANPSQAKQSEKPARPAN